MSTNQQNNTKASIEGVKRLDRNAMESVKGGRWKTYEVHGGYVTHNGTEAYEFASNGDGTYTCIGYYTK